MKKRMQILMLVALMLVPLVTLNCARDDVAIVRIQIQNLPQGAMRGNSLMDRLLGLIIPHAHASSGWASDRESLEIRLSAPDLVDVITPIPLSTTELAMEIPAGADRKISVFSYTSLNAVPKNWGGHAIVSVNPGDETTVTINMLPMTNISNVMYSAEIMISWETTGIVPNYGTIGYRVYRAEVAEGPYAMIAQTASSPYMDTPVAGKRFYYKIAVYTATSEGELTDSKTW